MKQFFKFVFASCSGTILAFGVLTLIFIIIGISHSFGNQDLLSKSVLTLDLANQIPQKTNNVNSDPFALEAEESIGLRDLKKIISHAAENPKIKGIVINGSSVGGGQTTIFDLCDELKKFKSKGKFVYSYQDFFTQSGYFLASVSDSIFLNPNGAINLVGFGTMIPFYKPLMDKVGFDFDIFYAGKYKSATEPFRLTSISEANREQTRSFIDDIYQNFANEVASNRSISLEKLDTAIENFDGMSAKTALKAQLIDSICYKNEFEDFLRRKLEIKASKKIKYVSVLEYSNKVDLKKLSKSKNKIAVVYAEGKIIYNDDTEGSIDNKRYIKTLTKLRNDKNLKAIVLRVNSPGGSSLTSDIIWNEIEAIKKDSIPVITSMGDYAASGGYYIACNSDLIVASPSTLTGSIGVYSMLPNVKKLMNEKIGVLFDTIKTHHHALSFNSNFDLDQKERTLLQEMTDNLYEQFLSRVAKGRLISMDAANDLAQGRVWTGNQAFENGLVDTLGNLDLAIQIAAEKAGISDDYKVLEYPFIKENPIKKIIAAFNESNNSIIRKEIQKIKTASNVLNEYQEIMEMCQHTRPIAKMPFSIIQE